jgi:hypothetical protein
MPKDKRKYAEERKMGKTWWVHILDMLKPAMGTEGIMTGIRGIQTCKGKLDTPEDEPPSKGSFGWPAHDASYRLVNSRIAS